MRATQLLEPGRIELREVEVPQPGPGEVVVKIGAALTCGTDLKTYRRGHPKFPFPFALGHEFSGTIAAVGPGVSRFAVGQDIMSVHSAPCLECRACQRGLQNLCDDLVPTMALGAFAEYLLVPPRVVAQNMYPKPDQVSFVRGAFLEPLACVVYGQANTPVQEGDTVVVCGCGTIGLLHVMLSKQRGAGKVLVTGRHRQRLDLALELGADEVIDIDQESAVEGVRKRTEGRGAEVVIECVGRPQAWEEAIFMAAPGGFALLFGGCPGGATAAFDCTRVHYEQITMKGVFHFTPRDVREAYGLLCQSDLPVEKLLSGTVHLEQLPAMMERLDRGEGIKYAIVP